MDIGTYKHGVYVAINDLPNIMSYLQYKDDVAKATEISIHVHELEESLQDKNDQLRKLVAERGRHMEELYEMK